jgi:PTS system fructose-specific IIC component
MNVSPTDVLKTAVFDLDLEAREYRPAIHELIQSMASDKRVLNEESFRQAVLLREDECSTSIGSGVSFPHARTAFVSDLVLAVGRSRDGIAATDASKIHLIFLIGTPKTKIQEYLAVVGFLARNVKQQAIFEALLRAETPEAFVKAFSGR